jgi:hypothetical protein
MKTVNSQIRITSNKECLEFLDEKILSIEKNSIIEFAKKFYEDVPIVGDGIDLSWSYKNIGSKWAYLHDSYDIDKFIIFSYGHPPIDFLKHLYSILNKIDESVEIELTYSDESNDAVGAILIKDNKIIEKSLYDIDIQDIHEDDIFDYIYELQYKLLKECNSSFDDGEYEWI